MKTSAELTEAQELIEWITEVVGRLDYSVHRRAPDFFNGVEQRVQGIAEHIERSQCVTERQLDALRNMKAGVQRWFRGRCV